MSWDIFVQDIPASARTVSEIPPDFRPGPVGSRAAIIEGIEHVVPTIDFSDRTWGMIADPSFSIEVDIEERDPVQTFALHVRGDDVAAGVVADILQTLGLRAFDPHSKTGIFDPALARNSLRLWRQYRDQVTGASRDA